MILNTAVKTLNAAASPRVLFAASWPPSPPCSTTSARSTPSATTRSAGSSAPRRKAMRVRRPPWATAKPARSWRRPPAGTLLHHGLRWEELCSLRVRDLQSRQGVPHLRIFGKGSKVRYVPAHPLALERIHAYLAAAGHGEDAEGPLFRPLKNPAGQGKTDRPLTHGAVYHRVLRKHAEAAGIDGTSFGPHAWRATATTNALDRGADLAQGAGMAGPRQLSRPPASTTGAAPGLRTAPLFGWRIKVLGRLWDPPRSRGLTRFGLEGA